MSACWPEGVPARMPAQDRCDIEETFARYAWGIDLADEDMVRSAFAKDGSFDHLWQGEVRGHDAIIENLKELWYDRQHWWLGRQHLFQHFLMTPTQEGARVRSMFQILQFNVDYGTNFVFGIGTRDDRLVKEDGVWVFKRLFVNAWRSLEDVPFKGEVRIQGRPKMSPPRHELEDEE
ncbi:nuclear transport factor 2 family protein [Altericroceibacterium xinjiangense]|uniref:nuclear transport factor 2 family protein n=1 Tax=Altericroceibacterium xinjiangense TaxID=762261 RepID=UPI000F7DBC85|nr:nuclear transport factor 2 family protein [Altericroceibacterium xinjiangense]